jgi:predicted CoA-binding protein
MRTIREILESSITIAVVGATDDPSKPSHQIPAALQRMGYRVIPVNPKVDEVLGERAYPDLASVPEHIDIVDVFRRPEHAPAIAHEAVAVGASALWLQLGIRSDEARAIAEAGGMDYVEDRCLKVEAMTRGIDKRSID